MSALVSVMLITGPSLAASPTHSAAAHTGDTGSTEETGGTTTTWGTTTATHSTPFCDECVGAAALAGDPGGSPCDDGCSTGGRGAAAWLVLPLLLAFRRRR
ncbi:MAG: hypothetical protein H6738_25480 [Alphaproteobacteria bacterium]|nr:hypothetical protein [Alphaproteobacteria bacterium]MCB9700166.1 hypothetical protein [Alphaproteobacteria bacterium]